MINPPPAGAHSPVPRITGSAGLGWTANGKDGAFSEERGGLRLLRLLRRRLPFLLRLRLFLSILCSVSFERHTEEDNPVFTHHPPQENDLF